MTRTMAQLGWIAECAHDPWAPHDHWVDTAMPSYRLNRAIPMPATGMPDSGSMDGLFEEILLDDFLASARLAHPLNARALMISRKEILPVGNPPRPSCGVEPRRPPGRE